MLSKRNSILMVLAAAAGVFGSLQVDRRRDAPRFPPEFAARAAGAPLGGSAGGLPPEPAMPGGAVVPDRPVPPDPGPGPRPRPVDPPVAGEIRPTLVSLQAIESEATLPVRDTGDNTLVVVQVGKEGGFHWGGLDTGSLAMLSKLMRENASLAGLKIILAPDQETPWKHVAEALSAAREAGIGNVVLGGFPTTDSKRTLLAEIKAGIAFGPAPDGLPEGMDEIPILVKVDDEDNVVYVVMGETAEAPPQVYEKASPINSEYATMYGVDYSRVAAKSPWVIRPDEDIPAGKVLRCVAALRLCAVYAVRFE